MLRAGSLGQTEASGSACARSDLASMGTGANSASGPSRFGESKALERSSPRNSLARYSSATATPPTTRNPVQSTAAKALFRPIHGLLKPIKIELSTSCRKSARQCQPFLPARLLVNYAGREKFHGLHVASTPPPAQPA